MNNIMLENKMTNRKGETRKYRERHLEEIRERNRIYRETHKEQKRNCDKKWREDHLQEIKQYRKDNLVKTKEYNKILHKKSSEKRRLFLNDLLKDKKCHLCGNSNWKHLVFHHLNPDEKERSVVKLYLSKKDKIFNEIKKCVILCANCHAKIHYIEANHNYKLSKGGSLSRDYKELLGCENCGEHFGPCLQYHHVNPNEKIDNVSEIRNLKDTIIEIEKCEVLCANCHGVLRR